MATKDLTLIPEPTPDSRPFDALEELAPGQYWTYVGQKIDGGKRRFKGSMRIAEDEKDGLDGLTPGTVHLVSECKYLDGAIHNVSIADHPTLKGGYRMTFAMFRKFFVRCFDAEEVRDREIGEVMAKIDAVRKEIVAGPPKMAMLGHGESLPPPTSDAGLTSMIQHVDRVEDMQKRAKHQIAVAQEAQKWVTTRTEKIGKLTDTLGDFFSERAMAARSSAAGVLAYAEHLSQGVQTLGLYTGKDVDVTVIKEGEHAPPHEPLTLMQRLLYVDEELAIHIMDGQGFTHQKFNEFRDILRDDPALVDRIFPTQRCVVAMRPRRHHTDYFDLKSLTGSDAFAAGFRNAELKKQDERAFLLVRDGENIVEVYSELGTDATKRLFPTRNEMEEPFQRRRWGGSLEAEDKFEEITVDDVEYTDSWEKHESLRVHYRRLCILLWGLNDRLKMFGDFYQPSKYKGFLDMNFQAERFRFIYDDDAKKTLGHGRPSFTQWWRDRNSHLRAGSRVLCLWKELINQATAPSCMSSWRSDRGTRYSLEYAPTKPWDVCTAVKYYDNLVARIQVHGEKRGRGSFGEKRTFTAAVRLDVKERQVNPYDDLDYVSGEGYLVLDDVRIEDVRFYLNSRTEREGYLKYIKLFYAALQVLEVEQKRDEPLRDEVLGMLDDARIETENAWESAIEAIRQWRATQGGRDIPDDPAGRKRALRAISDQTYRLIKGASESVQAVESLAGTMGRTPIRLTASGSGNLVLYTEPLPSEKIDEGFGGHFWAARLELKARSDAGFVVLRTGWVTLRKKPFSDETVVHDFLPEHPLIGAQPPDGLEYASALKAQQGIAEGLAQLRLFLEKNNYSGWEALFEETKRRYNDARRTTQVWNPWISYPVGTVKDEHSRSGRVLVVSLAGEADEFLALFGDEHQRKRVLDWSSGRYLNKEYARVRTLTSIGLHEGIYKSSDGERDVHYQFGTAVMTYVSLADTSRTGMQDAQPDRGHINLEERRWEVGAGHVKKSTHRVEWVYKPKGVDDIIARVRDLCRNGRPVKKDDDDE